MTHNLTEPLFTEGDIDAKGQVPLIPDGRSIRVKLIGRMKRIVVKLIKKRIK